MVLAASLDSSGPALSGTQVGRWPALRTRLLPVFAIVVCALGTPARLVAQTPPPVQIGGVAVAGSVRTRVESWDWFGTSPNGTYTYPGILARVALGACAAERIRLDFQEFQGSSDPS